MTMQQAFLASLFLTHVQRPTPAHIAEYTVPIPCTVQWGGPAPGQPKCPPHRLCSGLQWLSYPSACNTTCARFGDLCGKKNVSKTITAKDEGMAKASKSAFESLLELPELWKRGLEDTSRGQLPLPTPSSRSCSA